MVRRRKVRGTNQEDEGGLLNHNLSRGSGSGTGEEKRSMGEREPLEIRILGMCSKCTTTEDLNIEVPSRERFKDPGVSVNRGGIEVNLELKSLNCKL